MSIFRRAYDSVRDPLHVLWTDQDERDLLDALACESNGETRTEASGSRSVQETEAMRSEPATSGPVAPASPSADFDPPSLTRWQRDLDGEGWPR